MRYGASEPFGYSFALSFDSESSSENRLSLLLFVSDLNLYMVHMEGDGCCGFRARKLDHDGR